MNKQIRVYVNGHFQFAITAKQEEPLQSIGSRAANVMKIGKHVVHTAPGVVNIRTVG